MGFNDWIYVTPASSVATTRTDEIDAKLKDKIAGRLQDRLRGRLDQGLSSESTRRANAVRSYADGGRIVIDQGDDPAKGTTDEEPSTPRGRSRKAGAIEDLFTLGSGVPEVGEDGSLAFRTIDAEAAFGRTPEEQKELVDHTVTEVLQLGMVDMFEQAVRDVENEHPSERSKR